MGIMNRLFAKSKYDTMDTLVALTGLPDNQNDLYYEIGYGLAFTYILCKGMSVDEVKVQCEAMLRGNLCLYHGIVDGLDDLAFIDSKVATLESILTANNNIKGDCKTVAKLVEYRDR